MTQTRVSVGLVTRCVPEWAAHYTHARRCVNTYFDDSANYF